MNTPNIRVRKDILHPDLSYAVMGVLFEVNKELGYGHKERYYENAVALGLNKKGLKYDRQLHVPLQFKGEQIGYYFLDFLIEGILVLELKQGNSFSKKNIDQVLAYLKANSLELGILAQFTADGVKYKRIVNIR